MMGIKKWLMVQQFQKDMVSRNKQKHKQTPRSMLLISVCFVIIWPNPCQVPVVVSFSHTHFSFSPYTIKLASLSWPIRLSFVVRRSIQFFFHL